MCDNIFKILIIRVATQEWSNRNHSFQTLRNEPVTAHYSVFLGLTCIKFIFPVTEL